MRICSLCIDGACHAGVLINNQVVPVAELNRQQDTDFPLTLDELISQGKTDELHQILINCNSVKWSGISLTRSAFCAPYLNPPKIWGIGLNYRDHAVDLDAVHPEDEPASFMKPATAIIGPGETVRLPAQSRRVTGEAEIGIIIKKECKQVSPADVRDVILGYTTIIDMTAEDILRRNPRFLTRSKSFDTFFSFGPWIVTADEITDVNELEITTVINGVVHRSNRVGNMAFPPYELVAFHSEVMTLKPGDIISCGTPGAVPIRAGDRIGCEVTEIGRLENPVAFLIRR